MSNLIIGAPSHDIDFPALRPQYRKLAELTGIAERIRKIRYAPLPEIGPAPKAEPGRCKITGEVARLLDVPECDRVPPRSETGRPSAYCGEEHRKLGRNIDQGRRREHDHYIELVKWSYEIEITTLLNEELVPLVQVFENVAPDKAEFRGWYRPRNPLVARARFKPRWRGLTPDDGDKPEDSPNVQVRRTFGTGDLARGSVVDCVVSAAERAREGYGEGDRLPVIINPRREWKRQADAER
jgi:hypothetical protein